MSLCLHRAESADRLVAALAGVLATPLTDPFATEVVCVPTPGVERWLSQELSRTLGSTPGGDDGICAGVDFSSPRRLVERIVTTVLPDVATTDPWRPERSVWPLLRVIDDARDEPWAALLWAYLGGREQPGRHDQLGSRPPLHGQDQAGAHDQPSSSGSMTTAPIGTRRFSLARELAELFARYASLRPRMIEAWQHGEDVDTEGCPLPPTVVWQAELWRRFRAELDTPSPVDRLCTAERAVRDGAVLAEVPNRLSIFGATRLDPGQLSLLIALAERCDVHLWLPHPSPSLWARITDHLHGDAAPRRRADDRTESLVDHRLLAYLGRDSRELQLVLARASRSLIDFTDEVVAPLSQAREGSARSDTLLSHLQHDLAANTLLRADENRPVLAAGDRSVELHASHGPDRQVEVLRELLVGMLADDPTLEPRDIVVMCPDIETFAPLIAASFGLDTAETEAEHPGHRLRVRLADRSLRQLNPLLAFLARLVEAADSRMEIATLLDLCAAPPVSRKFGFRMEDLERLRELAVGAGVRWGLDAADRTRFGMGDFAQNTWAAGLERLLLGAAMDESDQHFIGTTLPMDEVDSSDVDLVGRLSECVTRIDQTTQSFRQARSVVGWVALFKQTLQLLTAVSPADSWQLGHAYAELGRIAENAAEASGENAWGSSAETVSGDSAEKASGDDDSGHAADSRTAELRLGEVSALLAEVFRGRPSRANFRTGTLTMCTMLPMRAVPHRIVCLLGLDDGVFPRLGRTDGDDLTAIDPWVGDRDLRSSDRQLLLDAIMAAQDRLVVIYAGMDPRSGLMTPPAVPVSELLDTLDQTAQTPTGDPVRARIVVRHPLQPFDKRNFTPGALVGSGPFSFDRAGLRGRQAATSTSLVGHDRPDGSPTVLPALDPEWQPTLADLNRFFAHPQRVLLRERAGLSTWREDDATLDQIPAGLDGLDRWKVGDRMLRQHLRGAPLATLAAAEWRRGSLPPRAFGQQALDHVSAGVEAIAALAEPFRLGPAQRMEIVTDVAGERLTGSVVDVFATDLVRVSFSRLSAKARLQSWIDLLALSCSYPEQAWRAVTIGNGGRSVLGPVPARWAGLVLADLIELQRTGLVEPIPFTPRTSFEYAQIRRRGQQADQQRKFLNKVWIEERDTTHERFFGRGVTFGDLLSQPTRSSEVRGDLGEPSRFGTLARRVFQLLLDHETR